MRASSRTTVTDSHLRRGCPICLHQIELDHLEALASEELHRALKFAEHGYGALFLLPEELELIEDAEVDPDRTLPAEWTGERATVIGGEALGFAIVE